MKGGFGAPTQRKMVNTSAATNRGPDCYRASIQKKEIHNMNGKGSRLQGGALTSDAIDSSRKVLSGGRAGTGAGLQQYFTPSEVGDLLGGLFEPGRATLDPTAGDGGLLDWVAYSERYGIEIDRDQIERSGYKHQAIRGDIQRVYPYLRGIGAKWPQMVVNPPFGLEWSFAGIDGNKKKSSTLRAFELVSRLLDGRGQAAFICGRDRFDREIAAHPEANAIWAKIEVNDLFEGVGLACVVCLMVGPEIAAERLADGWVDVKATRAELPGLCEMLAGERQERTQIESNRHFARYSDVPAKVWETVTAEVEREHEGRKSTGYDLRLQASKLRVNLSEFAIVGLATDHYKSLQRVRSLNGLAISWVALNQKEWRKVAEWGGRGLLRIDPKLIEATTRAELTVREELCPLYEVRPQQRLGYLEDVENILCVKSDPEKELVAGEGYPIYTRSDVQESVEDRPYRTRGGEFEIRTFTTKRRVLSIRIAKHHFNESAADVEFILEHFEVPNPGDLADLYPESVARARAILDDLTIEHDWEAKGLAWKDRVDPDTGERIVWQREDLARIVTKGRAILGWEQGGGKSLGLLAAAFAAMRYHCLPRQGLFVVPQDLIPQWEREAKRFFDAEFEKIDSPAKAREVKRRMKRGEEGLFITWYEALSLTGSKDEPLPHTTFQTTREVCGRDSDTNFQSGVTLSTEEACPSCSTMDESEWKNRACRACGYVHKSLKVHTIGSHLATAFKRGVICVDELSLIRGIDSKRGKAVRGLRAKCRFSGSGTPIANYISDAFNGLWWTSGGGNIRFPYDYQGGRTAFEDSFAVVEVMGGSRSRGEAHKQQRRKVLPQVTNVSQLWRLLAASMVRRRQEYMGDLVKRTDKKVEVPLGTVQRKLNQGWLDGFAAWFEGEYPDHPLVEAGMVERFAPAIGQLAKLEAVATMPPSDPHIDYAVDNFTDGRPVSAYTPAVMKALELALRHVRNDEKVLIGSSRIDTGHFIAERLSERGVRAAHIVELKVHESDRFATKSPKKRAKEVKEFCEGEGQVLCVGIEAMKLGHDLAAASVAIVIGLPWSHESDSQFCRRVHRLSSQKPVSVYRIVPTASLAERKFGLLSDKSAASDLALDGQLIDDPPEPVNWEKQIKQMRAAGLAVSEDDTLDEADLEELWRAAEGIYEPILAAVPAAKPKHWAASATEPAGVGAKEFAPFSLSDLVKEEDGQLGFGI